MKRVIAIILTVMMFAGLVSGCSAGNEKHFEYEDVSGGIKITKYTGNSSKVVVPETIDGKLVVSVGNTFSGNVNITSLELPEECIEANLTNCKKLIHLVASKSVLDDLAYSVVEGLETLVFCSDEFYVASSWIDHAENLKKLDISSAALVRVMAQYDGDFDYDSETEYYDNGEYRERVYVYTVEIESNFSKKLPNLEEIKLSPDLCKAISIEDSFREDHDYMTEDEFRLEGDHWGTICDITSEGEYSESFPNCSSFSKNEYNQTILNALGYDELTINGVKCKK